MTNPDTSTAVDGLSLARRIMGELAKTWPSWTSPDVLAWHFDLPRGAVERVLNRLVRCGNCQRNGTTYRLAGSFEEFQQHSYQGAGHG